MRGHEPLDREAIVAAVDLPALADALLGRRGSHGSPVWSCPATGHDANSPVPADISIFTSRRGEQRWACQDCGTDGSAIDLVMHAQRLGFRDALEFLSRRTDTGTMYPERDPNGAVDRRRASQAVRTGLDGWIDRASELLWQPFGSQVRDWLTNSRGLPADVLRLHRIGATSITLAGQSLPTRRSVDGPRTSTLAAVLPVVSRDQAIFSQLRIIDPPEGTDPYIHPRNGEGPHPRLALYRPAERLHPEILVTEGIIDAISANAAGYRAAAVLAPGLADASTAVHLSRLAGPLVLAFDPDDSGTAASDRLAQLLWAQGRRPALLAELGHDLNDSLVRSTDWSRRLAFHVRHATAAGPPDPVPEL